MSDRPEYPIGQLGPDGNVPAGWRVTGPDGSLVAESDSPTAAEMTSTSESERGEHDGSDRSGSGE